MTTKPATPKTKPAETTDEEPVGEAIAAAKEAVDALKRWSPTKKQIGIGAAVGIGSAAIVAGLLYWRGARK